MQRSGVRSPCRPYRPPISFSNLVTSNAVDESSAAAPSVCDRVVTTAEAMTAGARDGSSRPITVHPHERSCGGLPRSPHLHQRAVGRHRQVRAARWRRRHIIQNRRRRPVDRQPGQIEGGRAQRPARPIYQVSCRHVVRMTSSATATFCVSVRRSSTAIWALSKPLSGRRDRQDDGSPTRQELRPKVV